MLYKRIANAADEDALRELQVEMIDRFGLLPTGQERCSRCGPRQLPLRLAREALFYLQRGVTRLWFS